MSIIKSQDYKVIKEFCHSSCGTYAVEIEDMKERHWIVLPEDIEEPEFRVDGIPVDVLEIYQENGTGIVGYLVQFPDGRKLPVEHIDSRPMQDEKVKYECKEFDWNSIPF